MIEENNYALLKDNIAKNMLKDEMSLDIISKYTGLTVEEIEKLK